MVAVGFLLATVSATSATLPKVTPVAIDGKTPSSQVTCIGEPVCLAQVCNPNAYGANIDSSNGFYPYDVKLTSSGTNTNTTFTFTVCSTSYTSPLTLFQIRIKDSVLNSGNTIMASPAGSNWPNCSPLGVGYVWNVALSNPNALVSPNTCQSFSVDVMVSPGSPKPTIADICAQNVTLVDNQGNSVFDGTGMSPYCLVTMQTANKATGFGAVKPSSGSSSPSSPARTSSPKPYGASPSPSSTVSVGRRRF